MTTPLFPLQEHYNYTAKLHTIMVQARMAQAEVLVLISQNGTSRSTEINRAFECHGTRTMMSAFSKYTGCT